MDSQTIHVLLVDDEQLSRFVVGNLLRKCNYAVTVVDSGMQALDILRRSAPGTFQLVLTDLMMPEVDGLDILRFVRGNTALTDLPVIVMSANEQRDTVFQAIKGGAEEYLVKPVTRKEVQNIWQHVWKRSALLQQQQQQQAAAAPAQARAEPAQQQPQPQQPGPAAQPAAAAAAAGVLTLPGAGAGAGDAAPIRPRPSRGLQHLQQQQKMLQQQSQQHAQQQRQHAQLQELQRSMQELHRAQQQQQLAEQQPAGVAGSSAARLAASGQQQQHHQDFESLAFFLGTLHGHRSAQVAELRSSVADLDTQMAQVQAALQQLQQQQPLALCPADAAAAAVSGSGAGVAGETAPAAPPGCGQAPAAAAAAAADAAVLSPAGGSRAAMEVDQQPADDADDEDEDDEMERRERSGRRHKRQRLVPQHQHQQQHQPSQQQQQGACGAAALQQGSMPPLVLQRACSSTDSGGSPVAVGPPPSAGCAAAAVLPKWQHVSDKFDVLETVYLRHKQTWEQEQQQAAAGGGEACGSGTTPAATSAGAAAAAAVDSPSRAGAAQQQLQLQGAAADAASSCGSSLPAYLQDFGDDLWSYGRYSRLAVRGTVRAAADVLGGGSAMVCAAAFDRDDEYVATAGVSKRIRIFEYSAITSGACTGGGGCAAAARSGGGGAGGIAAGYGFGYGGFGGGCTSSPSGSQDLCGTGAGGLGSLLDGDAVCNTAAAHAQQQQQQQAAQEGGSVVYPVLELSSRSRLSCVAWSPYIKAQLASSDYEGVVQLWDANTGSEVMQLEEHGKRAWAVDYSRLEPTRLVSSSDDGTIKLWSIHQESSTATLQLSANVCSVAFSPESPHLLAAGCAHHRFYLYDLRNTAQPLVCVPGHRRAVSYVRWLGGQQLVTASTDGTLRLWDVPGLVAASAGAGTASGAGSRELGGAAAAAACRMSYRGHTNQRNFIGLAVLPGTPGALPSGGGSGGIGGYIACGSENNSVYAYHSSVPAPVTSHSMASLSLPWGLRQRAAPGGGGGLGRLSASDLGALADLAEGPGGGRGDTFVSCVAWNTRLGTLVAANSAGHIQVLELV